ncbi:MAG: endonuclease domain-containing protein [Prevotellaceae bacterium]|nr:endonuclease domain-containing protein [Candidatus Minthosoma equi]
MWKYRTAVSDRYQLLKDFARENRKNPTLAETVLWQSLKSDTIGTKVLRQHIIGDYIVDFLIPYYNLVIEVDGGYHAERTQQEDDAVRSDFLNSNGFYVMRFTNEQVLYDTECTLTRIQELIERIKK